MSELENWTEVTTGIYRYRISDTVYYEIHIMCWVDFTSILASSAELYLYSNLYNVMKRELKLKGPLEACLQEAKEYFKKII